MKIPIAGRSIQDRTELHRRLSVKHKHGVEETIRMEFSEYIFFRGDPRALWIILPLISAFVFSLLFDLYLIKYLKEPWSRSRTRYLWVPLSHPAYQARLNSAGRHVITHWRSKLRWCVAAVALVVCVIVI